VPGDGFLWTPGWWGWESGGFIFHEGYWGPTVGFYGGINYGFGYFGRGYEGGRWDHDHFYYNRSVNNINVTEIHNVYNTTVVNNTNVTRVAFNGGSGGVNARPSPTGCAFFRVLLFQREFVAFLVRMEADARLGLFHSRSRISRSQIRKDSTWLSNFAFFRWRSNL
jgi:hypothetical protein